MSLLGAKLIKVHRPNGAAAWIAEGDLKIRVTADGYVRTESPFGYGTELILSFPQVVACYEEEKREWWKDSE